VAAARELENAPLLRRSGANSVLTTSGATGRILGLAAVSPHYVQVVEELLEHGAGLDLTERRFDADSASPLSSWARPRELVVAVFRDDECVARTPAGDFILHPGDQLVAVTAISD
jgi:voltage-gated potassium channel